MNLSKSLYTIGLQCPKSLWLKKNEKKVLIEPEDDIEDHKEFLAKEELDPRYELAKKLISNISGYVTVLAYNMEFEKSVSKTKGDLC